MAMHCSERDLPGNVPDKAGTTPLRFHMENALTEGKASVSAERE